MMLGRGLVGVKEKQEEGNHIRKQYMRRRRGMDRDVAQMEGVG